MLKNKQYPPYDAVLARMDSAFLSYDLPLIGLQKVQTFATRLESTSQVFAYGHDLFLARLRPDKKYDMLDEEFAFPLLFAFIAFLLGANVFANRYMRSQGHKKKFLTQ